MIRANWRDWRFWRWWWRACVPTDAKLIAVALVVLALLVGGYFASGRLTGASAASPYALQTTITKVVTVNDHGRTVVKRVPFAVSRTVARSSTSYDTVVETRVVTKSGRARVVTRKAIRTVPVVHGRTVRNNVTSVVTNEQTVTQPVTTVATKTVTPPPTTVTQTQTQTQTQTIVQTVTQPPETVTVTTTAPGITVTLP